MFEIGEYVVCGNNGVCRVEGKGKLNITGVDKHRLYYFLKPIYGAGSTVYVPVDTDKILIRRVMSKEEAKELLDSLGGMELMEIRDEKTIEREYKELIQKNDSKEWGRLLKTIQYRKKKRNQKGSKITATDSKYYKIVGDRLYGELALVLDMDRQEVEKYVMKHMEALV